jgi:hypothetical protein
MIKIQSKSAARIRPGDRAILGVRAVRVERISRIGDSVTLIGEGNSRTVNAFQQILIQVPVNDLGNGVL